MPVVAVRSAGAGDTVVETTCIDTVQKIANAPNQDQRAITPNSRRHQRRCRHCSANDVYKPIIRHCRDANSAPLLGAWKSVPDMTMQKRVIDETCLTLMNRLGKSGAH
jgi:hypothetical protein